jgi:regulation of enolase protein 1 (concanavalin A-like superfamily)
MVVTALAASVWGAAPVSDDFHSNSLNTSLWTFVNPLNDASISLNGTEAVISLPAGAYHDVWTGGNDSARIMQSVSNVDFQVEVKFNSSVTTQHQGEGIIVEQDSGNFIRFDVFHDATSTRLFAATFVAGTPTTRYNQTISSGNAPFWLRVTRSGNTWTQSWSRNGTQFTNGAVFSFALTVNKVGPFALNSGVSQQGTPAPAFTEIIDYFFNTASRISPEDGGVDLTPTSVSVTPSSNAATVTWSTADWSTSKVSFGLQLPYNNSVSNSALVLSHSLNLTGLTCNTLYHYNVTSADSTGYAVSSSDATFTTAPCTSNPPVISAVSATPSSNSAVVNWTTDVAADSRVDYGLTSAYGANVSSATLVVSHSLTVSGLSCGTLYHYKVTSTNSGGSSSSSDATFNTVACSVGGPVSDDFHSSALNSSLWSFVAPCCGFLQMDGTDARLIVPSSTYHDVWTKGNQSVRLMQPTSNLDFDVEVKFDSAVTQQYQEQGIIVEQDSKNFLRFDIFSDGTTPRLFAASFVNGTPTTRYNVAISGGAPIWMRVKRAGNTWTQSYSTDGTNFTPATSFSFTLAVAKIGPFAGNAGNSQLHTLAPSFTALVDYFFNRATPISPTDAGEAPPSLSPVIDVWYGDIQNFGQHGVPQQWVNILGTVSDPVGISSLTYSLNGGSERTLAMGPKYPRSVDTGDFNAEIDHSLMVPGTNTVVFTAIDKQNRQTQHTVTVNYTTGQTWPLPYSIDWSTATDIQAVAQVIDGKWKIQPDGTVRTQQTGYDRLITLGDISAWTDYEVTAEVTVNAFDCHDLGVGIVVGWQGHTTDDNGVIKPDQPRTGHPFPGLGWYSTLGANVAPNAQFNIYANTSATPEKALVKDTTGRKMIPGVKYMYKFQTVKNTLGGSQYSLKVWPASSPEPTNWDLQADGLKTQGSVVLGAHRVDVSFGKINVVPLP